MPDPTSTPPPEAVLPAKAFAQPAWDGEAPALLALGRSFQQTVDLVEKSFALLAESATLLERKDSNVHLAELRVKQLRMAERHVADGERRIWRQRELVAALERDGHDARAAKLLLQQFEEIHAVQTAHLEYLQSRLEQSGAAGSAVDETDQTVVDRR